MKDHDQNKDAKAVLTVQAPSPRSSSALKGLRKTGEHHVEWMPDGPDDPSLDVRSLCVKFEETTGLGDYLLVGIDYEVDA